MTKHYFFNIIFIKFYFIHKNVTVIFATKYTNFVDVDRKLFKKFYDCTFTLNLVKFLFVL